MKTVSAKQFKALQGRRGSYDQVEACPMNESCELGRALERRISETESKIDRNYVADRIIIWLAVLNIALELFV